MVLRSISLAILALLSGCAPGKVAVPRVQASSTVTVAFAAVVDDAEGCCATRPFPARATTALHTVERGRDTGFAVLPALFPNLRATALLPALSETIGHLDLLEEREDVVPEWDGNLIRYAVNSRHTPRHSERSEESRRGGAGGR